MSGELRNVARVSMATMLSRVLGMVRDVLLFAMLGASGLNSAFLLAFTLPNLFRRLLGEGALTSALVPVLSGELEAGGKDEAFALVNSVLTWTGATLVALTLAGGGLLLLTQGMETLPDRWQLATRLGVVLFPYMIFVCLAAALAAALNVLQRFTIPALSQVWLNLAMIVSLGGFGWLLADTPEGRVGFLCGGVLVGGALQVGIAAVALNREGWRWRMDWVLTPGSRHFFRLLLPGLAAAAIFQVNIATTRLLAFWVDETAVAVLYLAARLLELPLGVFAIAVTTVIFPGLARAVARGSHDEAAHAFQRGTLLIAAITVPAALGLAVLRAPIVELLFAWGLFGAADLAATTPVVAVSALGMPFYAAATLSTRGFHAMQDMRTPVALSALNFGVNIGGCLLLMVPFGTVGLAAANVIAMVVHCVMLRVLLGRKLRAMASHPIAGEIGKIAVAAALMGVLAWGCREAVARLELPAKPASALAVGFTVPVAVALYFGLLKLLRFSAMAEVSGLLARFSRKRRRQSTTEEEDSP